MKTTKIIMAALLMAMAFSFAACNHRATSNEDKKPTPTPPPAPGFVEKTLENEEDSAHSITAGTYVIKITAYDPATKKGKLVVYKKTEETKKSKADFEITDGGAKVKVTNAAKADGSGVTAECEGFANHEPPVVGGKVMVTIGGKQYKFVMPTL